MAWQGTRDCRVSLAVAKNANILALTAAATGARYATTGNRFCVCAHTGPQTRPVGAVWGLCVRVRSFGGVFVLVFKKTRIVANLHAAPDLNHYRSVG